MSDLKLEIVADADAECPRTWSNLGTMVCRHRNYKLGDEDGMDQAVRVVRAHFSSHYLDEFDLSDFGTVLKLLEDTGKAIVLPLYLYDHSGITMSTKPFSCPWDSGQVGYIFITKEKIRSEYSWTRITTSRCNRIEQYLNNEVEVYDQYLTGDIWGFRALKDGEEIDSCWGFYGSDPLKNGIAEHLSEPFQALLSASEYERCYA